MTGTVYPSDWVESSASPRSIGQHWRKLAITPLLVCCAAFATLAGQELIAQIGAGPATTSEARAELVRARQQERIAKGRAERLEIAARDATAKADRTAQEAAALAARIQQNEAQIATENARIMLIRKELAQLNRKLALRRGPLARLTASLQNMARRPPILAILQPRSLRDTVYLRAVLDTTIPEVERRTASLRVDIERGNALEQASLASRDKRRTSEQAMAQKKARLAAVETRQRLASRQASGAADREAERALALAEEARDLNTLLVKLDQAGSLRKELAALPGPVLRPTTPETANLAVTVPAGNEASTDRTSSGPPGRFQLPVLGRTVSGFGATDESGLRSKGVTIAPADGAQVVAPGAGRVAFAGPYAGYGRIVIIEHDGGWSSLVTGLARIDVEVGDDLVAGAPLGVAGTPRPSVTFELRRGSTPVNPLQYM